MRVKQTAKKITSSGDEIDENSINFDEGNFNSHIKDTTIELSDNEVEFVVECRRDLEGNQFLLDGTLVIEPAPVADTLHQFGPKTKQAKIEEIDFTQFLKEINSQMSEKVDRSKSFQGNVRKPSLSLSQVNSQVTVKCTACHAKLTPFVLGLLYKHPILDVILCKECMENQKDKYFVIDEDDNKETLCRWCVEGGSLICCDFCSKSYCKTCIKRNLGRTVLSEILNQDDSVQWKCFSCDPTPIKGLQETCQKIFQELNSLKERRLQAQMKKNKKPIPRINSVNKKRTITKAFMSDSNANVFRLDGVKTTQDQEKYLLRTEASSDNNLNLLNSMEGFGTDWYRRNVNLDNILTDIDNVDCCSLLHAINSTKKCVEAFYSDIRNLENEIDRVGSSVDMTFFVSMFKSIYRHHIFNRFCLVQSRIEEDKKVQSVVHGISMDETNGISKQDSVPNLLINSVVSNAPAVVNNHDSFTPSIIAKRLLSDDEKISEPVLYSIDLTDDTDKVGTPMKVCEQTEKTVGIENTEDEVYQMPKEVVDLCNDDESSPISFPFVSMNFNNTLFAENKS